MKTQLVEEEKQILDALRSLELYPQANKEEEDENFKQGERLPPTAEYLHRRGRLIYEMKTKASADWTNAFERLRTKEFIQSDGPKYMLTRVGRSLARKVRRERIGQRFSDYLIRSESSKAHSSFCERVFGKDLCQANLMDMIQLEKLLEVLNLTAENRVLDMGCGIGKIAEYISDRTRAHVLGIDIALKAIQRAQARTQEKRDRLEFREGDLNDLSLPPASVDTIIAVATLHYAENLEKTVGQMKTILTPQGQMGLFTFQYRGSNESLDILRPDKTQIGQALKKYNLVFRTWDFTEREKDIWRKELKAATDLESEFRAEGNLDLCEDRIEECKADLPRLEAGEKRRYLYHVQMRQ
ncbi:MAG: class I SAM-dependent methyltransferase [Candidatus Thorarchaeota archaeon]